MIVEAMRLKICHEPHAKSTPAQTVTKIRLRTEVDNKTAPS